MTRQIRPEAKTLFANVIIQVLASDFFKMWRRNIFMTFVYKL